MDKAITLLLINYAKATFWYHCSHSKQVSASVSITKLVRDSTYACNTILSLDYSQIVSIIFSGKIMFTHIVKPFYITYNH